MFGVFEEDSEQCPFGLCPLHSNDGMMSILTCLHTEIQRVKGNDILGRSSHFLLNIYTIKNINILKE